jgi:hypothetical protein
MKNVTNVGILIVSGFLSACHTKDSSTQTTTQVSAQAPVPVSPSPIDTVRNGYLESNKTTTIGKALAGTFPNGTWKTFTTNKGTTIVEFDGFEPFSQEWQAFSQALNDLNDTDAEREQKEERCFNWEACRIVLLKRKEECISNPDAKPSCLDDFSKQHANDLLPVSVQFSVNQDGKTFQYEANNMGWDGETLVHEMYK